MPLCVRASAEEMQDLHAVTHGTRETPKIALTFDACPAHDMKVDWAVLETLIATQTKATLFLSGKWMVRFPEAVQILAAFPQFEFGQHSYSHPHMTQLTEQKMVEELRTTQEIIKNLTGRTAAFFRPPFGEYNDLLLQTVRKLGMTTIEYEVISGDPSPTVGKTSLVKRVTALAQNGSIIIMHVNGRGWHTAEALPEIIQNLKSKGFEFVTVSELLSSK